MNRTEWKIADRKYRTAYRAKYKVADYMDHLPAPVPPPGRALRTTRPTESREQAIRNLRAYYLNRIKTEPGTPAPPQWVQDIIRSTGRVPYMPKTKDQLLAEYREQVSRHL